MGSKRGEGEMARNGRGEGWEQGNFERWGDSGDWVGVAIRRP